ncbi:MAG: MerR family transcriptional regulator [Bacteroidota bacterium]|jgi:DNA-binding transcriptional MerR regulator
MAKYSIKELENLSGIKAHTLRIWEKRYGIIQPHRTETNIRYYGDKDLKHLLNITILNRHGMKISEIATLSREELGEKVMNIAHESSSVESQIENLIIAMIDLDEAKFDQVLSRFIMHEGFEKTVIKVIFPFFEKIGLLWQTGNINPAHEHFVSNLFRQKLMVAIDNLVISDKQQAKKFILFLPEGEFHELGLLFYNYLIKRNGHLVYYLGSSVPFNDIVETSKIVRPDYLFTAMVSSLKGKASSEFIRRLSQAFPFQSIFITGRYVKENLDTIPSNVIKIASPSDLVNFLKNLL